MPKPQLHIQTGVDALSARCLRWLLGLLLGFCPSLFLRSGCRGRWRIIRHCHHRIVFRTMLPTALLRPRAPADAAAGAPAAGPTVAFQRVGSVAELDAAVAAAKGKTVMLDFYADWCVSCKEMERYTFTDPAVQSRLAGMIKLQADVTAGSADHQALLKRFRLFGPPGIVFFDPAGREIQGLRVIGFQSADKFSTVLDQALGVR